MPLSGILFSCGFFSLILTSCEHLFQDAQCGEGTRTRNIFCVVYDGSSDDIGKKVDEEYCGEIEPMVDGNKKIVLEETCTVPCPGISFLCIFCKTDVEYMLIDFFGRKTKRIYYFLYHIVVGQSKALIFSLSSHYSSRVKVINTLIT